MQLMFPRHQEGTSFWHAFFPFRFSVFVLTVIIYKKKFDLRTMQYLDWGGFPLYTYIHLLINLCVCVCVCVCAIFILCYVYAIMFAVMFLAQVCVMFTPIYIFEWGLHLGTLHVVPFYTFEWWLHLLYCMLNTVLHLNDVCTWHITCCTHTNRKLIKSVTAKLLK